MLPQLWPLLLVYSGFQFLTGLGLGGCKCPGIYPFLPGLQIYVRRVVCSNLWWWFVFLWNQWWYPLYHFLSHIFDSSLFSFLLIWLVVYFVVLFKKPAPGFVDFFLKGLLCLYLLCSDLSYFLSSASFWVFFLFCFSGSFNYNYRVSVLDLSSFLLWTFSPINFPQIPL